MAKNKNKVDQAILEHTRSLIKRCIQSGEPLYDTYIASMEKPMLTIIMKMSDNNQSRAARALGISRGNLISKLKQHGLFVPKHKTDELSDEDEFL